jgi:hypothetical protein
MQIVLASGARASTVPAMRTVVLIFLVACAGSGEGKPAGHADASPPDATPADAFATSCGKPGDQGNELGVGKFCATLNDCSSTPSAGLCSNLGDQTTFFCTRICQQSGAADQCGTGATCTCDPNGAGCGCTPDVCLQ